MKIASVMGVDELDRALQSLGRAVSGDQLEQALLAGGYVLEGKVKISMAESKTGHRYGKHTASAPGEAPAMDTGALANSIMTEADDEGALVGTNMEYAEPLEFGTARMVARPFMQPAVEAYRGEITDAVQIMLKRSIEGM